MTRYREVAATRRLAGVVADQRGAEQMEYVLIFAVIGIPAMLAARLMWAVLLRYFQLESLIVDLPFF